MHRTEEVRNLVANLQFLIKSRGWSIRKFKELCLRKWLSERTVRDVLAGRVLPKPSTLEVFASLFDVTIGDLFNPPGMPQSALDEGRVLPEDRGITHEELKFTPFGNLSTRVLDDQDFAHFVTFDATDYGLQSYDNTFLRTWRTAHPTGVVGLFDGAALIGGVGLWPLDVGTAVRVKTGKVGGEEEIAVNCISKGTRVSSWYFGGIVIARPHQRRGYVAPLFDLGLNEWVDANERFISEPFEVVAVLVARSLHAKADRWGLFRESALFQNKYPIVSRLFSTHTAFRTWIGCCVVPDLLPRSPERTASATATPSER